MLLRTCLLGGRFHYKRDHDATWELWQMMLVWRLQRQTLVAMGLCLVLPDTWTPLWQMNCKDTVEIWEVTLSLFLLFSNHFLQSWDLLVVWRRIVRIVHVPPCRAGSMASCTIESQHWDTWEQKWCKGFSTSITSSSCWPLAASTRQGREAAGDRLTHQNWDDIW